MSNTPKFVTTKITNIISEENIISYQEAYAAGKLDKDDIENDGYSTEEVEQILNYVPKKIKQGTSKSFKLTKQQKDRLLEILNYYKKECLYDDEEYNHKEVNSMLKQINTNSLIITMGEKLIDKMKDILIYYKQNSLYEEDVDYIKEVNQLITTLTKAKQINNVKK